MKFKRDKIFDKFAPVFAKCEEIATHKDMIVTGLVKVYKTNYSDVDVLTIANTYDFNLKKENPNAASYHKLEGKHDVCLIYNKNDKSIMFTVSRAR